MPLRQSAFGPHGDGLQGSVTVGSGFSVKQNLCKHQLIYNNKIEEIPILGEH